MAKGMPVRVVNPPVADEDLYLADASTVTVSTSLIKINSFFEKRPANTHKIVFQLASGGPLSINSLQDAKADGTLGSVQVVAGDTWEVTGDDIVRHTMIRTTTSADGSVRAQLYARKGA